MLNEEMRDEQIRAIFRDEFDISKSCVEQFTKEELILVYNNRYKRLGRCKNE